MSFDLTFTDEENPSVKAELSAILRFNQKNTDKEKYLISQSFQLCFCG